MRFLNRDNPLVELVSTLPIVDTSVQGNRYNTESWSLPLDTVLTDRRTAAGWLLEAAVLERDFHVRYWKVLEEEKPGFLSSLWVLLFGEAGQMAEVLFAREKVIKVISPACVRYSWLPSGLEHPCNDWLVTT